MKTPEDKVVTFTFASHPTRDLKMRWTARLTFPSGAGPDTPLTLAVDDGEGAAVGEGVFELAGMRIPVRNGKAEVRYRDFVEGRHETALWLHRKGMLPIPGGLTFA